MTVNNIAMFKINDRLLYREYDLVKFDFAYLFVCIDKSGQRYIVIDLDSNEFLIAKISAAKLINMINDRITMRDVFTGAKEVFHVISGDSLEDDVITVMSASEIPEEYLPDTDSYFERPDDKELDNYINKLKQHITAVSSVRPVGILKPYSGNDKNIYIDANNNLFVPVSLGIIKNMPHQIRRRSGIESKGYVKRSASQGRKTKSSTVKHSKLISYMKNKIT